MKPRRPYLSTVDREVQTFEFPYWTGSHSNARGHWRAQHARADREKDAVLCAWISAGRPKPSRYPAIITFVRVASRQLDKEDNLNSAFKYMRDEMCRQLGFVSGPKGGCTRDNTPDIEWRYAQRTPRDAGKRDGSYWVIVEIESADPLEGLAP